MASSSSWRRSSRSLVRNHRALASLVVRYDQDWGTRWRKGRLLRKQLLGAVLVYGSLLGILLWWNLS